MKIIYILSFCLLVFPTVMVAQNAPVTSAGQTTNAVPGDPSVPVSITSTGFTDIGGFTLTIKFDTLKIQFVSASTNPSLAGMAVNYIHPVNNTQGKLILTWTGVSNISLADGSSLADLTFHYITGSGILTWGYAYGTVCMYKRFIEGILTTLNDNPKYLYYLNGGISDHGAPVTFAPTVMNPVPGPISVPVTVNNFNNISALTLYLEYDPAIMSYLNTFTYNPGFVSNFLVGDNPGAEGKRRLVIQWFGSVVSLSDESVICTLNFTYLSANCIPGALAWFENGPSCEFADLVGDVLIDMPQTEYFVNGLVAEGLPAIWTGNVNNDWNEAGNWNSCGLPGITRDIIIPDVSPNAFPVVTVTGFCKSISLEPGATLTIAPTGSITVGE